MRKALGFFMVLTLAQSFLAFHAAAQPSETQLKTAYDYAMKLYTAHRFDDAKVIFKKIAMVSTTPALDANAYYYYAQCAFHTEDYDACVKSLDILVQKYPLSSPVKGGFVFKFCFFLINQVAHIQSKWDYYRYPESKDEKGEIVWKESIPPGFKIKRINFRLGFGLLRVLNRVYSQAPQTAACKKALEAMLNVPLTIKWVDEKAPPDRWSHPTDFLSFFTTTEKKNFSKFICERMFYNWKTEKLYLYLDMHDDIRNLRPRFVALTRNLSDPDDAPPPATVSNGVTTVANDIDPYYTLTLRKLFQSSGYEPYTDSFTSVIESNPSDLTL